MFYIKRERLLILLLILIFSLNYKTRFLNNNISKPLHFSSIVLLSAKNTRFDNAPPMYTAPGAYFAAPTTYYMPQGGYYAGVQAPVNVFPEQPPGKLNLNTLSIFKYLNVLTF